MKVIDIMQKVANKEIFKFRINDINYYVDKSNHICEEDGTKVEWYIDDEWLNMNAEIIEEDKKIEKMTPLNNVSGASDLVAISQMQWENNLRRERKINEIIDYLEENK